MNKAVFSDLDGTLIRTKSGKTFPVDKDDWVLDLTVLDAIYNYMFKNLTGTLCIVTNQGGVEAGFHTRESIVTKLEDIRKAIFKYFMDKYNYNVKIDSGACYTNDPTDFMRKPNPGLGYHLGINNNLILTQCVMIGDASGREGDHSDSDEGFASNCVMNYFDVETFVMVYSPNDIYKSPML
jgi:DNA 3'-phosphatase